MMKPFVRTPIPISFAIICLLAISMLMAQPTSAQRFNPIGNLRATHTFGKEIIFEADLLPDTEYAEAYLTYQTVGSNQSVVLTAEKQGTDTLATQLDISAQNPMPAFARLTFWFTLEMPDGSQLESEKVDYLFTDNRFDWQTHPLNEKSDVNWVEGDLTLAQSVVDVVNQHQENFSRYLDLPYPEELHIYIYPTSSSFQSAMEMGHLTWASGHASPDQNTILVAIPAGFDQQLDIQRQIPHEIAHIRLALYLGGETTQLPTWYNEGLASFAENISAPEYWQILQSAYRNDNLIPLETLCDSFPYASQDAALAYAESESFVRYLESRFGKNGLQSLLDAYKQGHTCQSGVSAALGTSMERLEADWFNDTFDSGMIPRSVGAILSWVILLVIIFAAPIILFLVTSQRKGDEE